MNINATSHSIKVQGSTCAVLFTSRLETVPKNLSSLQKISMFFLNSFQSPYFLLFILLFLPPTPNLDPHPLIPVLLPPFSVICSHCSLFSIPLYVPILYFPLFCFLLPHTHFHITPYFFTLLPPALFPISSYLPSTLVYTSFLFSPVFPLLPPHCPPSLYTLKPCLATHHFSPTSSSLISM